MTRRSLHARGFSTHQTKTLVAGVIALAAVGLAVRAMIPDRSERTDTPKPSIVRADGTAQSAPERRRQGPPRTEMQGAAPVAWNTEDGADRTFSFEELGNAENTASLLTDAGRKVEELGTSPGLGDAVASFLIPVAGGEGTLGDAISSLGGNAAVPAVIPETLLATVLDGASIDVGNVIVREPDEPPRAVGGLNINRSTDRTPDPDGGPDREVNTTTLSTSFENHFPDAVGDDAKGELAEVLIPFLAKGSEADTPDLTLRLVMRRANDRWQPAAAHIITTDPSMMQTAMTAVRSAIDELNAARGG